MWSKLMTLAACILLLPAQTAAQEALPINPDITGMWKIDSRLRPQGDTHTDYDSTRFPNSIPNLFRYRDDRLLLDFVDYEFRNQETLDFEEVETLVLKYSGEYVHTHDYPEFEFQEPYPYGSGFLNTYRWGCGRQTLSFEVEAEVTLWYSDLVHREFTGKSDILITSVQGPDQVLYEHSDGIRFENRPWEQGPGLLPTQPRVAPFQDIFGNRLLLGHNWVGDPVDRGTGDGCTYTTDVRVTGVNTEGVFSYAAWDYWKRVPEAPLELTGSILGEVGTTTESADRGTANLYLQKAPIVGAPDQGVGALFQSNADALEFVGSADISPEGYFGFHDIPLFHNDGGVRSSRYLVTFEGVEIDIVGLEDPVPLKPDWFGALAPQEEDPVYQFFELETDGFLGPKRALVNRISAAAPVNLKPIEDQMDAYLDTLTADPDAVTDAQREGVKRSAWSERIVLEASQQAEFTLKRMFEGLAKVLLFVMDKLFEGKSASVVRGKIQTDKYDSAVMELSPELTAQFRIAYGREIMKDSKRRADVHAARRSRAGSFAKNVFTLVSAGIETGMIAAGVDSGQAKAIRGILDKSVGTILDFIVNQSARGALFDRFKGIFESSMKGLALVFFDNRFDFAGPAGEVVPLWKCPMAEPNCATVEVPGVPSFAGYIAPYLTFSVQQASSWSTADPVAYDAAVSATASQMFSLIDEGTAFEQEMLLVDAVGKTGEKAGSVLGVIGELGLTQAKGVALIAQIVGVSSYVYMGWRSLYRVLVTLPERVENGVASAWGAQTPLSHGAGTTIPFDVGVRDAFVEAANNYSINDVYGGLRSNNISRVAEDIYLETGNFNLSSRQLAIAHRKLSVALASSDADPAVSAALGELDALASQEDNWLHDFEELVADLLLGQFTSNEDLEWRTRRDSLALRMDTLAKSVKRVADQLESWDASAVKSLPMAAVVSFQITNPESGMDVITEAGQTFVARAEIATVGSHEITDLSARLTVSGPDGISVGPSTAIDIGTLAASDADLEGGADQTSVEWTITLPPGVDPSDALFTATLDLLEGGDTSTSWIGIGAREVVGPDPEFWDSDLDGMLDSWETANGLTVGTDDSLGDADGDGLNNASEYDQNLDPQASDSDSDGLNDFEELYGTRTDPNEADTDGDGTPDGADQAPLDFASTSAAPLDEPVLQLDTTSVELDANNAIASIRVTNAGGGVLSVGARAIDNFISVSPSVPARRDEILIQATEVNFGRFKRARTEVIVWDDSGANPDPVVVEVILNGVGLDNDPLPSGPETPAAEGVADTPSEGSEVNSPWWIGGSDDGDPSGGGGAESGADGGCCRVASGRSTDGPGVLVALLVAALTLLRRRT